MSQHEALKLALDALTVAWALPFNGQDARRLGEEAIEVCRAALAEPPGQPVAWTLTKTITEGRTTTSAHLWFSDPKNCMWTPLYAAPTPAQPESNKAEWWALVTGAAAAIEDASNSLRDEDAIKQANGAAKHYREKANALYAATPAQPAEPLTDERIQQLWDEHTIHWKLTDKTLINPVVFARNVLAAAGIKEASK